MFWGGTRNSATSEPFTVRSGGGMLAAGGMTWRTCAIYCNWLSNGKRADAASFMSGAYDVSTFGEDGQGGFTDQLALSPGAAYWIPTFDEWIKDAHYDVDKPNDDGSTGGWWQYNITSDTAPRYGPPGFTNGNPLNQANAGFSPPGNREFSIPLGAYTEVTSPWGLYDTAGATGEWLEEASPLHTARGAKGSQWSGFVGSDVIWSTGGESPATTGFEYGFRLAGTIPAPSSLIAIGACGILGQITRRRPRHETCSPRRVLAASRRSLVSTSVVWLTPALFATLALA